MKEEDQYPHDHPEEQTIVSLLSHLQHMRRAVPVNYQLKADLKKQLLQRMSELELQNRKMDGIASQSKRKKWARIVVAAVAAVVVAGSLVCLQKDVLTVEAKGLLALPAHATEEQVDIDSTGNTVAYLAPQSVIRTLSLEEKKPLSIALPPTKGEYKALAWANHSKQVAVVEQTAQQSRIWIVDIPDQTGTSSSRLLKEEQGVTYRSPTWSPTDDTVAYTRIKNGVEEIWMSSTVSFQEWKMAEGSQPAWSPSGRFLAFTKEGNVQILELRTGKMKVLGKGSWPSWSSDSNLTYTTPNGHLAEAELDEDRLVAVKERDLMSPTDDQIVRGNWASDGTQLLLVHHDRQPDSLVISLASR